MKHSDANRIFHVADKIVEYSKGRITREDALTHAITYCADTPRFRLSNLWVHTDDDTAAFDIAGVITNYSD